MSALIVGGYDVAPIKEIFRDSGIDSVEHWVGDKTKEVRRAIPQRVRLILILCDFVNHSLVRRVKAEAGRLGLPVIFCRRSLGEVRWKLEILDGIG